LTPNPVEIKARVISVKVIFFPIYAEMTCYDLVTEAGKQCLAALNPSEANALFWKLFLHFVEIPRPSGHLDRIVAAVESVTRELGKGQWDFKLLPSGNIIISVPASSPELAAAPIVCLQAHLDIVPEKDPEVEHDFLVDPIKARFLTADQHFSRRDVITATGTTLGADCGVGLAAAFAAAVASSHGPLELLFTADEEVGLLGASALEEGALKAEYLINLDNEDEKFLCVGCAGGFTVTAELPLALASPPDIDFSGTSSGVATPMRAIANDGPSVASMAAMPPTPPCARPPFLRSAITVAVTGGAGGHSGDDINKGRANAIQILASAVQRALPASRIGAVTGGAAHNAIASSASVDIEASSFEAEALEVALTEAISAHAASDPDLTFSVSAPRESVLFSHESSQLVLSLLSGLPHGVSALSGAVDGLVSQSTNVGVVRTAFPPVCAQAGVKTDTASCADGVPRLFVTVSARADSEQGLQHLLRKLRTSCASAAPLASLSAPQGSYPPWPPVFASPLVDIAQTAHAEVYGEEATVYALHAGLECGVLLTRNGNSETLAVSTGPDVRDCHTPREWVSVESVSKWIEFINRFVAAAASG
jgi:dipeptidase D